jgi:pimeloyl-ACP methyl ester carboxylesterase
MKRLCTLLAFTLAFMFSNAQEGLHGYWIDTIRVGAFKCRIILHFYEKDTVAALDFYSIDQGDDAIAFKDWRREEDSIFAKDKKSRINLTLYYDAENRQITGILKQGNLESPLKLLPIDAIPKTLRPQTPQAPFPYTIEEVSIQNKKAKITLSGTLTLPVNGENLKAIVLLAGSGAHDRDETIFKHKLLWVLADSLTRQGYAVLRYDKRGVGKSKGSYVKASITDLYEDASAAIAFLRNDKRIDANSIGVIGHSEGGVIAPIIAANDKKLAFIVSLAGSVQRGRELLLDQYRLVSRAAGVAEDTIETNILLNTFIYDEIIKNGKAKDFAQKLRTALDNYGLTLSDDEKAILSWNNATKAVYTMKSTSPWILEFIALQPEKYITKAKCPVLAIFGEKDIQVPAQQNADLMQQSLQKTKYANESHVEIIKGINHLMQHCSICAVYEYPWIEETIAPEILDLLYSWINNQLK